MNETQKKKSYRRVKTPRMIPAKKTESGAVSLEIILAHFGNFISREKLLETYTKLQGTGHVEDLQKAALAFNLKTTVDDKKAEELCELDFPTILVGHFNHFFVLEGFKKNRVYINDPVKGPHKISFASFKEMFISYSYWALFFNSKHCFTGFFTNICRSSSHQP